MPENNPFQSPGATQLTAWSLRMTDNVYFRHILTADANIFALFYACCASAVSPPEELRPNGEKTLIQTSDRSLEIIKDLQAQYGADISGRFAHAYMDGYSLFGSIDFNQKDVFKSWQEDALKEASGRVTSAEKNVNRLVDLLGLSETERKLLLFHLYYDTPGFKGFFDLIFKLDSVAIMSLELLLDVTEREIEDAIADSGTLIRSGILSVSKRPLHISPPSTHFKSCLFEDFDDDEAFFKNFVKELKPKSSTQSLARFDERDKDILLHILSQPVDQLTSIDIGPNKETYTLDGVNLFLYGSGAFDKFDLVARTCEAEGLKAYAVNSSDVPPSDMPAWTYIAQKRLEKNGADVLVIDRAEQALANRNTGWSGLGMLFGFEEEPAQTEEERATDSGVTSSSIHCLWMSDNPGRISEKNLGRFIFHCQVHPGSRADRRERIKGVVDEFGLSKSLEKDLSKYNFLGEHQVRQAAHLSAIMDSTIPTKEKKALLQESPHLQSDQVMRRAIEQSQRILGREETEDLRDSVTQYSLKNLNLNGKFTAEQIIKSLGKKKRSNLLFYGLPGTGKTQLAEYIAVELDMPLLVRRASDILDKFVGESEKNIARMFDEASAEGAILFLDEADSFLRDRALARAEWNVSQVNELLQQMERHDGIFIAATNLFQDLDAAVIRRFTWKLEFLELKPAQAWSMFKTESGFKGNKDEASALKKELSEIEHLTPGDFATVKRQANILEETLTPEDWIVQLRQEAKDKMFGLKRNRVGFDTDM